MKNPKTNILLMAIFVVAFSSCSKKSYDLPPNTLYFQLKKNGQILPDSVLSKVELFFYDSSGLKIDRLPENLDDSVFLSVPSTYSPNLQNKGILASGYVSSYAKNYGYNTMYLQYPNDDIDTLYFEVGDIDSKEGARDRCYCNDPFTMVKFNGKVAPEVTDVKSDDGRPIFLFEK